jgi:hypothetical protein
MARCLVLECVKEEGVQVVSVAAVSASSWRRRQWQWPAIPTRDRGAGELDLERERGLSAEKEREKFSPIDSNLHRLSMIFSGSGIQQRREGLVSMAARFCSARGSEEGANGWQERVPEGMPGFIRRGGSGLGCSRSGSNWASRAALWGSIVS